MDWMAISESLGDKSFNLYTYKFAPAVTEQFLGTRVCVTDYAARVGDQDRVRRKLEKIPERQVGGYVALCSCRRRIRSLGE
jgi:hypothetical protein